MITDDDIFTAAEDVLGVMILARRSDLDVWQTVKPAALGFDADSWIKFSGKVVRAFNQVFPTLPAITLSPESRKPYRTRELISFSQAIADVACQAA